MTNANDGSAQNALKEATSNLDNENILAVQNLAQEQELHSTHSFQWRWKNKNSIITCNNAGTVENSLRKSAQFREFAEKNNHKELVITCDRKALSSHFPCTLIKKDECLTVHFVKAKDKPKSPVSVPLPSSRNKRSFELVMFHVLVKGGKDIVKILKNPALKTKVDEITVYAYKGEKVKRALKRDGRFLGTIFKKNFVLSHRSTEVELSNLVDDLNGKTFQVILLNKSSPPNSLPGSLDEAYLMPDAFPNEAQTQSDSGNGNALKEEPDWNGNVESEIKEMRGSQPQLIKHLSSQFQETLKGAKKQVPKLSRIQNLLRVEFGQNAQMCSEVKTMKTLMNLSDSVCQVRINGRPEGSGFLLFGRCVLTNGHVIKDVYNENRRQIDERISVHFSYESVEQTEGALDVEEVVGFEYNSDVPGKDWALLRLSAKQALPSSGLLKYLGFYPEDGGICIIGHPEEGVKKIDPCLIVAAKDRGRVVEKHYIENQEHVQLVASRFFENVAQSVLLRDVLTYGSCFYHGSSGSPVFSKHCRVVAMHTAGYIYETVKGKTRSVIEYGQSLPVLIVNLLIQMVEKKRDDVLKEYLQCSYDQHSKIMDGVKKVVESRNLTKFRKSVNSLMETNDRGLRAFLEFFSAVPMETD